MTPKPFDILSCQGSSLISKGIRLFTGSKTTHTAQVVSCWGQLYVVDAQKNGVNPKPYDEWMKKYNYKYIIHRPKLKQLKLNEENFNIRAFSKVGVKKYDFFSLVVRQPLFILTGKWIGSKSWNDDKFYCSDYVGWLWYVPKFWQKSPVQLREYLEQNPNFTTITNEN